MVGMFPRIDRVFGRKLDSFPKIYILKTMSSKKNKTKSAKNTSEQGSKEKVGVSPISYDACNNVLIRILAKPGAKQNSVTDISEEAIGIQINASPVEGQANTELLKYIATVTGVKKSDITLLRGSRSRQKTLSIRYGAITVDEALDKFRSDHETN